MPTKWMSTPSRMQPVEVVLENFAGLHTITAASIIADNESPDLLNIDLDAQGRPDKRFGFKRIYNIPIGAGKINGMFFFVKKDGTTRFLIHHGTRLYLQSGSAQPIEIFNGMANATSDFFAFNDYVWILDGVTYWRYDGTNIVPVTSVAYIPTVLVSGAPAGGGTPFDDLNMLGAGFKQAFSGNGSAAVYQLALTDLDAAPPMVAVVNGVTINEGAGFTVNRATGTVTFSTAPSTGTNNVVITAYKTTGNAVKINQMRRSVRYGGTQDTRVFWYLNPNFPNTTWHSGLFDPSYAPENGFLKIGSDASKINNMVVQYDICIIVKGNLQNAQTSIQNEQDVLIWQMRFELLETGVPSFPLLPLNTQIDSIAIYGLQLMDNLPTWLSSYGAHQLVGSNVRDQLNVQHISNKVDNSAELATKGLLEFNTLVNSVSANFEKKYILALNDAPNNTAFVYDTRQNAWLKWDNIKASCFLEINNFLYFGDNSTGLIYRFMKITDALPYNDDGQAINCYWKSKLLNFGTNAYVKTAPRIWYVLKPSDSSSAKLSYETEMFAGTGIEFPEDPVSVFTYPTWDYSAFTYIMTAFPIVIQQKLKAKKFLYLQVQLSNNIVDQSMGVSAIHIQAQVVKMAK